jgi:DNA-binding transcriptional MerR regulator
VTIAKKAIEDQLFAARHAARVAGLSLHMLNYLCRHKVISPTNEGGRGRGRQRKYSFTDILLLRLVARLLKQGVSVLRFRKTCRLLESRRLDVKALLSRRYMVTNGTEIFLRDKNVLECIESGQTAFAFVLDLEPVRRKVSSQLSALTRAS